MDSSQSLDHGTGNTHFLCPALFHIPDEIRPFEDSSRVVHSGEEDVVTFGDFGVDRFG